MTPTIETNEANQTDEPTLAERQYRRLEAQMTRVMAALLVAGVQSVLSASKRRHYLRLCTLSDALNTACWEAFDVWQAEVDASRAAAMEACYGPLKVAA